MNHKNVIITGGSRGLGKGMATSFQQRGHRVFTISRNNCDVADAQSLRNITEYAKKEVFNDEPIHMWINNAAVSRGYKKFDELTDNDVKQIVSTNLIGTINGTKVARDVMLQHPDVACSIYNITGAGGDHSLTPYYSVYGSTKSAVTQFTKTLAKEGMHKNINLYLVSPGMMATDLLFENMPSQLSNVLDIFADDPAYVASELTGMLLSHDGGSDNVNNNNKVKMIRYFGVKRIISRLIKKIL